MSDPERQIVHWETIVGRNFMDIFCRIAIAEYWSGVKDKPIDKVYDKFDSEDIETYHAKRAQMRFHGWRQSYLTRAGNLKFMVMYDPKKARYISLSEYIAGRDADRMAADEAEYYQQKDFVKQTTRSTGRVPYTLGKKDDEFVREDD